ncbi:uncharacterized protein N7459_003936 [Penicillium hispanicum]|uniref:uncharacterized protein n=1 Tax=Penicillium hispanicum TaxID=1080232 RepID=UPI002541F96A|nr:uncharacterized protein N7459_003936 [Penicillium hispanicum]KAJ5584136.1 hypothetical protein N7459_003936 [Penicillium hispanicum]
MSSQPSFSQNTARDRRPSNAVPMGKSQGRRSSEGKMILNRRPSTDSYMSRRLSSSSFDGRDVSVKFGRVFETATDLDAPPGERHLAKTNARPHPSRAIRKASRPIDDTMYENNMWNMVRDAERDRDFSHEVHGVEYEDELDNVLLIEESMRMNQSLSDINTMLEYVASQPERPPTPKSKRRPSAVRSPNSVSNRHPTGSTSSQGSVRTPTRLSRISEETRQRDLTVSSVERESQYQVRESPSLGANHDSDMETLTQRMNKLPINGEIRLSSHVAQSSISWERTGPRGERKAMVSTPRRPFASLNLQCEKNKF